MIDLKLLKSMVNGALRQCINEHGPITKNSIPSAEKRIANQIHGHIVNELKQEALKKLKAEVEDGFVVIDQDRLNQLERGIRINRQGMEYWKKKAQELEGAE
jgi:hypothetical protein